jgi:hypothetical protein
MANTDPNLRKALLTKLGITPQALSQRVAKRKRELPMGTPEAAYTIAFDSGIDISKFLSAEETEAVRHLVAQLNTTKSSTPGPPPAARGANKGTQPKPALISIAGVKVEQLPGMSATTAKEAKTMSEKVYPTLYVFENSAREVISAILRQAFGDGWWDQVVPRKVRDAAIRRKDGEADNPWHGRRGSQMIDYTLLPELPKIVGANDAWPHFEPLFGRKSFFEELVNDLNVSRRVAAHMNPVSADDVKNIEAAFRKWSKTLKAKKDLLA